MKREDLELNRVYACTTRLPDRTELVFGRRYSVGLCRVVEIPPSGREILVKQVNGKLEPQGMSLAVPLQDIRIAGEADIEAAIRETRVAETTAAWEKMAKRVRADYVALLKKMKLSVSKLSVPEDIPYEMRRERGKLVAPEAVTYQMVERYVTIDIKGTALAASQGFKTGLSSMSDEKKAPARRVRRTA